MSGAILYDGWCGEPIAWARLGDPVIGQEWTEHGSVAVTTRLSRLRRFVSTVPSLSWWLAATAALSPSPTA